MTFFNPQPKTDPLRSKKYLKWIDKQPPLLSGHGDVTHHHVRIDGNAGTGIKPCDLFSVPLFVSVHNEFHAGTESDREFWKRNDIDIYRELNKLKDKYIKEVLL